MSLALIYDKVRGKLLGVAFVPERRKLPFRCPSVVTQIRTRPGRIFQAGVTFGGLSPKTYSIQKQAFEKRVGRALAQSGDRDELITPSWLPSIKFAGKVMLGLRPSPFSVGVGRDGVASEMSSLQLILFFFILQATH